MIKKLMGSGLFVLFLVLPLSAQNDAHYSALVQQFTYDATLPLNIHLIQHKDTTGFIRDKFAYDGWRGSRVPAIVAVPKDGSARYPVIVLIDGIGGWKERWWQATSWNRGRILIDSLLAAGYAVAMADAPASGERTYENDFVTAESFVGKLPQWRDMGQQNLIETRRLIDYLQTRADIDTTTIGVLGLSHGGMMTFVLSAVDPRVHAAVAGLAPQHKIPDTLLPANYASHITIPFLMLMGTKDSWYTKSEAESTEAELQSQQKQLVWYETGHRMPEEYAGAAVAWFRKYLR